MKTTFLALATFVVIAPAAMAAPGVTNVTQKGSLLLFSDIRIDVNPGGAWNTLIRLANDGNQSIDVKCYWLDGNKNRTDFTITLTRNQPAWFDARTGNGTVKVQSFPRSLANGFDNPYLITPPGTDEATDGLGPYFKGSLTCFAIDQTGQQQVKWNNLSGTATVYHPAAGAYEYNAYAFVAPSGLDKQAVGTAGSLPLDAVTYDACPLYQVGLFTPVR